MVWVKDRFIKYDISYAYIFSFSANVRSSSKPLRIRINLHVVNKQIQQTEY